MNIQSLIHWFLYHTDYCRFINDHDERISITWVSREHHGSPRDIELWSRADQILKIQKSILAAGLNTLKQKMILTA